VSRDWVAWHRQYDDPSSSLSTRLGLVQGHVRRALDGGARPVVSLCAGEGRDLLGVLAAGHPSAGEVTARLVERDPGLAAAARAAAAPWPGVEVVEADAGDSSCLDGAVPADLVLLCGIFGNVPVDHVERTARLAPMLCAPGAVVVWTRHVDPPDLTPSVRGWFAAAGFEELAFDQPPGTHAGVGAARLVGDPAPFARSVRMFAFG
jgi:hypothetical protein